MTNMSFPILQEDQPKLRETKTSRNTSLSSTSNHSHALEVSPDSISVVNGNTLEEITSLDVDDKLPKTNYTYANTASYSSKHLDRVRSVSPNMSRRRLRRRELTDFTSDDELEFETEERFDNDAMMDDSKSLYKDNDNRQKQLFGNHGDHIKRRVSENVYTSTPVYHQPISTHDNYYNGMLLRSGSHIKGASRNRYMRGSPYSTDASSHTTSSPGFGLVPTYRSDNDGGDDTSKSRMPSWLKTVTTTTTTTKEYDDDKEEEEEEDLMEEAEHKLKVDESQSEKKKDSYYLRNLDGLDREEEFSDNELIEEQTWPRKRLPVRHHNSDDTFLPTIMTFITSIITTTTATISDIVTTTIDVITAPFRFVGRGIVAFSCWLSRQATVMLLTEMDVKHRRCRGCCLPFMLLLILLPFLLLAGYYSSYMSDDVDNLVTRSIGAASSAWVGLSWPWLWLVGLFGGWRKEEQIILNVQPNTAPNVEGHRLDMTQLNSHIQQTVMRLFAEHRKEIPAGLTEDQVRDIVEASITGKLRSTKSETESQINYLQGNVDYDVSNLKANLLELQDKINAVNQETKIVASNLADTKASIHGSRDDPDSQWLAASQALETKFLDLRNDLNDALNQNQAMLALLKSCCHNNTVLADIVRSHLIGILAEVNEGEDKDSALYSLMAWMRDKYVDRDEIDEKLSIVAADITHNLRGVLAERVAQETKNGNTDLHGSIVAGGIDENAVKSIVAEALDRFSADRLGMPDFALESAGGSVLSVRCSQTYSHKTALVSVYGFPLYYDNNSPRTIIQPNVHPGECWPMKGDNGYVVIQLSQPIQPTGFTLEHIPKSIAPSGTIDSAPKSFTVIGLSSDTDKEGMSLGNYTFLDNNKPIQYFGIQNRRPGIFQFVELRIKSNHGNPEYTCIYRFRVHGLP